MAATTMPIAFEPCRFGPADKPFVRPKSGSEKIKQLSKQASAVHTDFTEKRIKPQIHPAQPLAATKRHYGVPSSC
jgi:hypothetical protein